MMERAILAGLAGVYLALQPAFAEGGAAGSMRAGAAKVDITEAIATALESAAANRQPARIGFGTTPVHLNVNRDLYEHGMWYQGPNPDGVSDKTLAVVALIGADNYPIAFYLNYAMHPIDFYLSGVISADFPGDTARYIESRYDNKAVAVFAQSACGDQNPLFTGPMQRLLGTRTRTPGFDDERFTAASPWKLSSQMVNANEVQTTQTKNPVTRGEQPAYQRAISLDSAMVTAMGAILGESAIDMGIERNLL